jgi:hypothetical protein
VSTSADGLARIASLATAILVSSSGLETSRALAADHRDSAVVARWPLGENALDTAGSGLDGMPQGVEFAADVAEGADVSHGTGGPAARFDGRTSHISVRDHPSLEWGTQDFSITVQLHTSQVMDDVPGDILSKFDPHARRGFTLGFLQLAGVTSSQANYRNLHFGIDNGRLDPAWTDCGRPGNSRFTFALAVYAGHLYAGTFEFEADGAGHVYRYDGGTTWTDCGAPDRANAIEALAVYNGRLYAGSAHYISSGSAMPDSPNTHPGGRVFRYEGDGKWSDCGRLENNETGQATTVGGMAVYQDRLYAGVSKPPGRGLYCLQSDDRWTYCGNPGHRVTNPVVYNGHLYLASLDGGGVTRYDAEGRFTDCGVPEGVHQTYGFSVYQGQLYTATWPRGEVFRYGGDQRWMGSGRLGSELEVMGMAVYNGKLYAGTLPLAEVYRLDGESRWTRTGQLDTTPDVRYRRAWSMAVYQGKLYCGTLPSGRVYSLEAGRSVTYDHELSSGWHHLAAVKDGARLKLYIDGKLRATSSPFDPREYDLTNRLPLEIGFGPNDYFCGLLRDVAVHGRALTAEEIAELVESAG